MFIIDLIWQVSIFLALATILLMAGLIGRRVTLSRREKHAGEIRTRIESSLFDYMINAANAEAALSRAASGNLQLLSEISTALLFSIRGEERRHLVELLRRIGVLAHHMRQLASRSVHTRLKGLTGLLQFDDPDVVTAIDAKLDDPHPEVRLAAALALSQMRAITDFRRLIRCLQTEIVAKSFLLRKVFRSFAIDHSDELCQLLTDDYTTGPAKELIVGALGKSGNYAVVMPLSELQKSTDPQLRVTAIRALGDLGHPAGENAVISGLSDSSDAVRVAAAIAAGKLSLKSSIPGLTPLLSDANWWVQFRAAEALYLLGDAGIAILQAAENQGELAAHVASQVLGERQGSRP